MLKKPMNLLKRAWRSVKKTLAFNATTAHIKRAVKRDNAASTSAQQTVADFLGTSGRMHGGAMGCSDHPERAFGEVKQRRDGHGSRPAKGRTAKRNAKLKNKNKKRKVA